MREIIAPTVLTIAFMLCVGLYGFIKLSYENDGIVCFTHYGLTYGPIELMCLQQGRPTTSAIPTHSPVCTPCILVDQNDSSGLSYEPDRLLVTYVYTESPSARENLLYFLKNGLRKWSLKLYLRP